MVVLAIAPSICDGTIEYAAARGRHGSSRCRHVEITICSGEWSSRSAPMGTVDHITEKLEQQDKDQRAPNYLGNTEIAA